jgi:hypothetical protein
MPHTQRHSRRAGITAPWSILFVLIVLVPFFAASRAARPAVAGPQPMRISQIYGGGGNSGATLRSDFIELFNASPDPINLSGWSVQYASSNGSSWGVTSLGNVTVPGFGYLLVRQASGAGGNDAGTPLEFPDVSGGSSLSASSGKVALVSSEAPISGHGDSAVVDFVGYGEANEAEGMAMAGLGNTSAALRKVGGCVDNDNNADDFEVTTPAPRNSSSAPAPCALPPTETPIPLPTDTLLDTPTETPAVLPTATFTMTATDTPPPTDTSISTPTATLSATVTATPPVLDTPTETPIPTDTAPLPLTETPTDTPLTTPTVTVALETPTPLATAPLSPTLTLTPVDTPAPTESATPLPTPTNTMPPSAPPPLVISEFLADPKAVSDNTGEWIELFNPTSAAVNLRNWQLADLDGEVHTIAADLLIAPGGYVVLGRSADLAHNGGAAINYVYTSFTLANTSDEILLIAPDGSEVDRVLWGGVTGVAITAGASLERNIFADPATWVTATTPWPGSPGDKGTPGAAYLPPPPTATPTLALSPPLTATVTVTVTPLATPSPIATDGPPPRILISEFLADPRAVSDTAGEWIELYNAAAAPVNLRGWALADLGSERHVISADLLVAPGAFVLLARNSDLAANGGVTPAYIYTGFSLANGDDEILLLAPDGREVDRVLWGGDSVLDVTPGVSLERTTLGDPASWAPAQAPWPGSSGDWGTPGLAYLPPAVTPTPTLPPDLGPPPRILISEFLADPQAVDNSDGEWIELYNASDGPVNLRGWSLADLGTERHTIAADLLIPPGVYVVLARNGDFAANGGVLANYVYSGFSLSNQDDEILLLAPNGSEVDRVQWGGETGLPLQPGSSLERSDWNNPASWSVATASWPTSSGDRGSPGAAYTPTPPTATPPPTPTILAGPPPRILISEFLADPQAVNDSEGEWIELYNATGEPVNLLGWRLQDLGGEHHPINTDLIIPSGGYLLLARNGDPAVNGGIQPHYLYSGFSLANSADEILLFTPDGREADRVVWGGESGLSVKPGVSLERVDFATATWVPATTPWPGSAGDAGTPGSVYVAAPILPTPSPSPLAPVGSWPVSPELSPLAIDEVFYGGTDEEFIVLINLSANPVDLTGWLIGDAQTPGGGEGIYALPDGVTLAPGALYVIARDGATFRSRWGQPAQAAFQGDDPGTPRLVRRRDLATGTFSLSDSGDEVVLLTPAGHLADAVAFKKGDYGALGLSGLLQPPSDYALQRVPDARFPATTDVRHRFLYAPPRPFEARGLPLARSHVTPPLADGLFAVWGSLGAQSNFSPGLTAPPHYLLAAASAHGLDFVALADPSPATPWRESGSVIHLAAWQWQGTGGERAVVYSGQDEAANAAPQLLAQLADSGGFAQWQSKEVPTVGTVPSFAADEADAPGALTLLLNRWNSTGLPLLPAGNANPPLPGAASPTPRYTGLAVTGLDQTSLLVALAARRGWLTNSPGLWLTLQAEQPSGPRLWMGSSLLASNELTLHITYGDLTGEMAGLALWQGNRPIRQLDRPPADGHWSVTVPAIPDSFLYAVATQADGGFAVTAPLRILPSQEGTVLINEVLPAPAADHNGDGKVDGDDEFIELYNPGTQPVALAGWQLSDNTGDAVPERRFTFKAGRYIAGGERLLLWRQETYINQNVTGDYIRLLTPDGGEVDRIAWDASPDDGWTISRLPDGGAWNSPTKVTPGQPNAPLEVAQVASRTEQDEATSPERTRPERMERLRASGPLASIAQAKPYGLYVFVEFPAIVTVPPGRFGRAIYVADPLPDSPYAGVGIKVYLRNGEYPALQVGDRVRLRGVLRSFRGELELNLTQPDQVQWVGTGTPLVPLAVNAATVGEPLEGRLVTFQGTVSGWQGDSIFLLDPAQPNAEAIRVTVLSSLGWQRPYVRRGERWQVTGIVSQFAREAPWNGGYRVLVQAQSELVRVGR